jgi:muconate cycloisomerase
MPPLTPPARRPRVARLTDDSSYTTGRAKEHAMKITRIDIDEVAVPCKPDTVNSPEWGTDAWEAMSRFIVRLQTDAGLTGLGETQRGVAEAAVRAGASALLGADPLALCWQELPLRPEMSALLVGWNAPAYPPRLHELPPGLRNPAYDAFEMAIFDLAGKALGVPVHRLLGGAYRERVPVDFWIGRRTPADAARKAREARALGYTGLKMKAAAEDPMLERVQAITDAAGPDFLLVIDPNERFYRPAEALRIAKQLEPFPNIRVFEDPFPKWNLDGYRQFRAATTIPVALHLGDPATLISAIKADACDHVNLGGGLALFPKLAAIADAAGMWCWHGSGVDLGIREAAYLHSACLARNCVLNSDIFGRLIREHDLLTEPLTIAGGHAVVPTGPGLGVELDLAALEHYRVRR